MNQTSSGPLEGWLRSACEDADRRGLPELKPLLETLARSTAALREADRRIREAELDSEATDPAGPGSSARAESTE